MGTFKDIAYEILKEHGGSLHSDRIVDIALKRDWLKTAGSTPKRTMAAQLVVDVNKKGDKSRFTKIGPSTYSLNFKKSPQSFKKSPKKDESYAISPGLSKKQKGDIVESRIAELIMLYGKKSLACYKPTSDDDGIDLIVKKKENNEVLCIQIKSRFVKNPGKPFQVSVKRKNAPDGYSLVFVFCSFDIEKADMWNYMWFVPSADFNKKVNPSKCKNGDKSLSFYVGSKKSTKQGNKKQDSNKWEEFLIDKRDLANKILEHMSRVRS